MVHSNSLLYFMLFCETHDLVWEIISVYEKKKNCIAEIVDNVSEKNDEGGLFSLNSYAKFVCAKTYEGRIIVPRPCVEYIIH